VLESERALLADLQAVLRDAGAPDDDQATLAESVARLDALFLLVIVGEFNAGKSALINALLGGDVLAEGVTPTTSRITIVRFGPETTAPRLTESGLADVEAPLDFLRDVQIVDTPGTNAVLREHEELTREFVPRADLVLFVTSADRPFTESERQFLERIRDWGKKTVLVVNKADIFTSLAEKETVATFVLDHARQLLGRTPTLFFVSARLAQRGRHGSPDDWEASGFPAFEAYLRETLDETERIRLKLLNPLGVGERLATALLAEVTERRALLAGDVQVLETIERQASVYADDLRRDFEFRMADVEKLLVEMERRGHDHFDETIRLARVADLLNRRRMHEGFVQHVIADTPDRIDRKVRALIDWLVDADFRQWQAVHELLAERRVAHRDRVARLPHLGRFEHDRARLLETVGREAERVVETYDRTREAEEIASKARTAVAASAAIEVGALGLGAVVAAVASTAAADMTGLAMAGVVATLGLLVIPNRRREAKRELREKVTALRDRLGRALRGAFDDELRRSLDRIQQHVEPYSRFVRSEDAHLALGRERLEGIRSRVDALRARVLKLEVTA
jgi:small GTP-binding protein